MCKPKPPNSQGTVLNATFLTENEHKEHNIPPSPPAQLCFDFSWQQIRLSASVHAEVGSGQTAKAQMMYGTPFHEDNGNFAQTFLVSQDWQAKYVLWGKAPTKLPISTVQTSPTKIFIHEEMTKFERVQEFTKLFQRQVMPFGLDSSCATFLDVVLGH